MTHTHPSHGPSRPRGALRRFLGYLGPFKGYMALSLTSTVFYVILSGALIWLIGPLVATIFGGSPIGGAVSKTTVPSIGIAAWFEQVKTAVLQAFQHLIVRPDKIETLARMCTAIVIISLLKNMLQYLQYSIVAYIQQCLVRTLRNELFAHYQELSLAYFARTRTGQIISRVTSDVRVLNDMLSLSFTRMIREPLMLILLLGSLFIISWKLALLTITVLPLSLLVMLIVGRYVRRYSRRGQERMADIHTVLEESIGGIRIVKAFGMQSFEVGRFREATQQYYRTMLKQARVRILNSPINEFLGTVAGVTILWFGGNAVLGGSGLPAAAFITFIFLVFSMIQPIKSIADIHATVQEGRAAAERIFAAIDTPVDILDQPGARAMSGFTESITYENISFRYDTGPYVLHNVDLTIPRGQSIALVGPSGGGKSTLCDLLARFYDPTEGRIAIDGADLRSLTTKSLREHLGIVTQDTVLFNDTVAHNIAYGLPNVSEEQLRRAAEAAYALEFIEALPNGFNTLVGTRGTKLSGGQRQRIAIARAVLRDPPILILDEATSSLDTESETAVRRAIANLLTDRTALIVAHRLSTVRDADRIVVVDQGRIIDSGTHDELLARGGLYRRLYELQFDESPAPVTIANGSRA